MTQTLKKLGTVSICGLALVGAGILANTDTNTSQIAYAENVSTTRPVSVSHNYSDGTTDNVAVDLPIGTTVNLGDYVKEKAGYSLTAIDGIFILHNNLSGGLFFNNPQPSDVNNTTFSVMEHIKSYSIMFKYSPNKGDNNGSVGENPTPPVVDQPINLTVNAVLEDGTILNSYTEVVNPNETKVINAIAISDYDIVGDNSVSRSYAEAKDGNITVTFTYRKVVTPTPQPNPDPLPEPTPKPPSDGGSAANDNGSQNPAESDTGNSQTPPSTDNGVSTSETTPTSPDSTVTDKEGGENPTESNAGNSQTPPSTDNEGSTSETTPTLPDSTGNTSVTDTQTPSSSNGDANGSTTLVTTPSIDLDTPTDNTQSEVKTGESKASQQTSITPSKTEAKVTANTSAGKTLPSTGESTGLLALLGAVLTGSALFSFRRKEDN